MSGTRLVFYTTAGCHLCEYADEMLAHLKQHAEITVDTVDISSSEELVEQYGIRIPVVKRESDGAELGWPFSYEELANLA